jgi:hypothetical protein
MNYLNEIISVFLDQNVNQLSDNDLSTAIEAKGKIFSAEEIRRVVQSSGLSVFQLQCNREGIFFVRIEPKVSLFYYLNRDLFDILDQYMSRISRWQLYSETGRMQSTSFMPIFWFL